MWSEICGPAFAAPAGFAQRRPARCSAAALCQQLLPRQAGEVLHCFETRSVWATIYLIRAGSEWGRRYGQPLPIPAETIRTPGEASLPLWRGNEETFPVPQGALLVGGRCGELSSEVGHRKGLGSGRLG